MKRVVFVMAVTAGVFLATSVARALTILDFSTAGIGLFAPASKANNDYAATVAANSLVTWYNGGEEPEIEGVNFTLANTSLGVLPTSLTFGYKDEQSPFDTINTATYEYVLGKYGNVAYLFYVADISDVVKLPGNLGGHGLSHQNVFDSTRTNVPDGGATLALLGLGLLGVEGFRRFCTK